MSVVLLGFVQFRPVVKCWELPRPASFPLLNNLLLALNGIGLASVSALDKIEAGFCVCQHGSEWMRQDRAGRGREGKFDRIYREGQKALRHNAVVVVCVL